MSLTLSDPKLGGPVNGLQRKQEIERQLKEQVALLKSGRLAVRTKGMKPRLREQETVLHVHMMKAYRGTDVEVGIWFAVLRPANDGRRAIIAFKEVKSGLAGYGLLDADRNVCLELTDSGIAGHLVLASPSLEEQERGIAKLIEVTAKVISLAG